MCIRDRYITLQEPRAGSVITIANAARHLVCLGVKPVHMAVAFHCGDLNNNTNFWFLRELAFGVKEGTKAFRLHKVNEMFTKNNLLHPITDVITAGEGTVRCMPGFKKSGDFIIMIGSLRGETGSSMYADIIHNNLQVGHPSTIDIVMESRLQEVILQGISFRIIRSAINVSRGGLGLSLILI